MKRYIYFNEIGRITSTSEIKKNTDDKYIYEECEIDIGVTSYIDANQLVLFPIKPNIYCIFDYTIKQWVDPRTPETQWPIVRQERDQLLQASDYTQLPDVPLTDKAAWATYRQALRDVTTQTDPFNIVWPVAPQS